MEKPRKQIVGEKEKTNRKWKKKPREQIMGANERKNIILKEMERKTKIIDSGGKKHKRKWKECKEKNVKEYKGKKM